MVQCAFSNEIEAAQPMLIIMVVVVVVKIPFFWFFQWLQGAVISYAQFSVFLLNQPSQALYLFSVKPSELLPAWITYCPWSEATSMIFVVWLSCSIPYRGFFGFLNRKDRQNICSSAASPFTKFYVCPPAHKEVYCAVRAAKPPARAPIWGAGGRK